MKNIGKITLFIPIGIAIFIAGTLYFSAIFGAYDWLRNNTLVENYGSMLGSRAATLAVTASASFASIWLLRIASTAVTSNGSRDLASRSVAGLLIIYMILIILGAIPALWEEIRIYRSVGFVSSIYFFSRASGILEMIDERVWDK
jgi:hypothetical protein